jgi:endonuclease III
MPRESKEAKAARLRRIFTRLRETYPDAHCELNYTNPLELLIATILSAQCTDKRVNLVTPGLFRRHRSAEAFANASLPQLENEIRTAGFYRNKAKNIRACCRQLVELTALDGVGRKTANVVLGNAFNINVGVVVDTHVGRLSQRLGLTRKKDPAKVEQDLIALVPQDQWTLFSHWLIWHGRRRCSARKPDCAHCEVRVWCPSAGRIQPSAERGIDAKRHRPTPLPRTTVA